MLGIARISLCIIYFFIQNTRFKSFLTFNMVCDLFKLTMRELWYDIEQDFYGYIFRITVVHILQTNSIRITSGGKLAGFRTSPGFVRNALS